MKRLLLFTSIFVASIGIVRAQGEMDAYKMSSRELSGTARSVGMGGAFGALGGDITGISINPAGIGIYKSSEVVTTMTFQNTEVENKDIFAGKFKESKFKFGFNNLAFVSVIPLYSDEVPFLNVGISYNRLKSFDRKYRAVGGNVRSSITDFMAHKATAGGYSSADLEDSRDNYPWNNNWLAVQGHNSGLIKNTQGTEWVSRLAPYEIDNDLFVRERGSVNTYDFNVGTTISDMLSVGLTVSVTDLDYRVHSSFIENAFDSDDNRVAGMEQVNQLKTEGTGWQVAAGLIFKPIHELRIGVAYHSRTWYNMTDHYISDVFHDMEGLQGMPSGYEKGWFESPEGIYDYKLQTPDRWTFSAAGVIGNKAIISLDYELTNYKNMRLKDRRWGDFDIADDGTNQFIKEDFRMASTIRVGAEYKPTQQFSIRAGYAFMQSPLQKNFRANEREVVTVGATTYYTLDGHTNHFTYGLGYRFTKSFYADLAFVYKTQKSDLYNVPTVADAGGNIVVQGDRIEMKTNTFQTMLTFGLRF